MKCRICEIKNKDLLHDIECCLEKSSGILASGDINELNKKYPEESIINELTDEECQIHWSFHMAPSYESTGVYQGEEAKSSLTKDINKDEASILFDLAKQQAATLTLAGNKINDAIKDADDISELALPTNLLILYRETAGSVRETVKLIKDINCDVNGSKSGALEGLKALANALKSDDKEPKGDLTTNEYDY